MGFLNFLTVFVGDNNNSVFGTSGSNNMDDNVGNYNNGFQLDIVGTLPSEPGCRPSPRN